MEETKSSGTNEGHGESSSPPAGNVQSPGTFAPLSQEPQSANSKTGDLGKKGHQLGS